MTFQPPPPPPPPAPPPGPAGQPHGAQPPGPQGAWGPPAGSPYNAPRAAFDPKTVNPLDWGILGAGLLAFIFSFVSYYTVSVSYAGFGSASGSESAWNGFFGWFAMLCALAGSALVAMELFVPTVRLPFPARLTGLALYAVATLCVILALFVFPEDVPDVKGIDTGHGVGYWISLIVIIAGLVLSLMRFQQGGGKLPGALGNLPNIGGYAPGAPGGAHHPGAPQNPPPGYPPPPPGPPAP
jgi:hypothetical protein